jgi:hypothetical protein
MTNRPIFTFSSAAIVSLVLSQSVFGNAKTACYDTPRLAIDAVMAGPSLRGAPSSGGYQVIKIQWDPVLGQRWAVVISCQHYDWPVLTLPLSDSKAVTMAVRPSIADARAIPAVKAGETVRLWRQEDFLRIQMAGIAEQNGDLGGKIRVRIMRTNGDDQSMLQQLSGIVRGPSDVEIQP